MQTNERITTLLLDFLRQAGEIANSLQDRSRSWIKEDRTLATDADISISALAHKHFFSNLQQDGHHLIDEERFKSGELSVERLSSGYTWVLDPIGGTAAYRNGLPFFGIYIGILKDGIPWIGGVYLPRLKELFLCDGEIVQYITNVFTSLEERQPLPNDTGTLDYNRLFFVHKPMKTSFPYLQMNPYTMAISLCYPLLGKGAGSLVQGKLWDICAAWPSIQKSNLRLRSIETGKVLEKFSTDVFDSNLRLKTPHLLCTKENFPIFSQHIYGEES